MTTYNKISEQIQRLYARQFRDKDDISPRLHEQEVRLLVNQVANELISAEPRAAQRIGDTELPASIIATYTAQPVNSSLIITATYATITALIAAQGSQTNNLYYWVVDATADTTVVAGGYAYRYLGTTLGTLADYQKTYVEFSTTLTVFPLTLMMDVGCYSVIPEPGNISFIPISSVNNDLLQGLEEGALENTVGFYREGRKIIYSTNPRTATVKVKLLINDITSLHGNEPFPISPQQEAILIQRVLQLLTGIPAAPDNLKE